MALVELLRDEHQPPGSSMQWQTPHLATLGVVEVPRAAYLARLPMVLSVPLRRPSGERAQPGSGLVRQP